MTSNSHLIPLSLLVPILPPLLLPTLLRAHAPNIISNVSPSNPLTRLIDFDLNLPGLLPAIAFSLLAVVLTSKGIQSTKDVFKERGFKGRDMLKPASKDEIPESMGLPSSCIYILLLFLFIPFRYFSDPSFSPFKAWLTPLSEMLNLSPARKSTILMTSRDSSGNGFGDLEGMESDMKGWSGDIGGREGFPHHELATFLSALLSLLSAIMLGFLDDVFDIRWRYKIPIPIISSVPLLVVYYAGGGGTNIVVPSWPVALRGMVGGEVLNLGPLYYLYISLLSTFCTNSINILAGINGVEVGQALIIALSICWNDFLYLDLKSGKLGSSFFSEELCQRHLFSLYLLMPFCGCCIGLLAWNKFPSKVFVGDTFCYFAGQVLACAGVLGHFSKTLLLFFIPQIFNFLLSCPQLFGFVPCPRHRLPRIHRETLSLYPSTALFPSSKPASLPVKLLLRLGEVAHIVRLYSDPSTGRITECSNLTLLNAILVFRGVERSDSKSTSTISKDGQEDPNFSVDQPKGPKITEYSLWLHVMGIQVMGSVFAFAVRYWVASIVFPSR